VRVFKAYAPGKQKSQISLVAHRREVSSCLIERYIPEFADEFFDKAVNGQAARDRNYVIKAYVFGSYLDRHVSLERGGFEFGVEKDLQLGIGRRQIGEQAAAIAREVMGVEVSSRSERKRKRVQSYVDQHAPWHRTLMKSADLSGMACNASHEDMESLLQKQKYVEEEAIRKGVKEVLAASNMEKMQVSVAEIVGKVSETSKNDLIHYVALRRHILDVLRKSLEVDEASKYALESVVHDIIFPRKGDLDTTPFDNHNLWLIDERLNFMEYVSSDRPLGGGNMSRPDLLGYGRRTFFRGENTASNPIAVFEFKRPQRDDFAGGVSADDPIAQIIGYVIDIREGRYKTPRGRDIQVDKRTPFFGYVVCDLTPKVEKWLQYHKSFNPMPDGMGWYYWHDSLRLQIEVISWDKVCKDAEMRNLIFFKKLGIE